LIVNKNQLIEFLTVYTKLDRNDMRTKIRVKREQEHQDLYWFTLHQGLHPISLPTSKEIHSKITNINQDTSQLHLHTARAHWT